MRILTLIFALMTVLLTGCSTMKLHIPKEEAFSPAPVVQGISIKWIVTDDPTTACKLMLPEAFGFAPFIPACAGWNHEEKACVIVTQTVSTHQILGHEVRHCFEGKFHD